MREIEPQYHRLVVAVFITVHVIAKLLFMSAA